MRSFRTRVSASSWAIRHGLEDGLIDGLPGSDERPEQVGTSLDDVDAKHRAPRHAGQHDLLLVEVFAEKLREFDAVARHAFYRDVRSDRT